jgi:Cu-processing system ATP-binding protein
VTVIITSHILAELQERVDRLAILAAGKVQAVGSVQALREQTRMPLTFEIEVIASDVPAALQALAPLGIWRRVHPHRPAPAMPA